MIPVIPYTEGEINKGTCYLIAGNGMFLQKQSPFYTSVSKVPDLLPFADDCKPSFSLHMPSKIPASIVHNIQTFFKEVVKAYRSEACTVLIYNNKTNQWGVVVDKQSVSHGGVRYDRSPTHADWTPVGTIHSHADFSAFHSGTDDRDEAEFDGIHCTFGHNDKAEFSISASVVIDSKRHLLDPLLLLDGLECVGDKFKFIGDKSDPIIVKQYFSKVMA